MKKKENKYKITPDIRKQITLLVEQLPRIPFLIKNANGESVLQKTMTTSMISGAEIKQWYKDNPGKGDAFNALFMNNDTKYSYQQSKMRLVNHQVELTQRYLKDGQYGIDTYVEYVVAVDNAIKEVSKPIEESPAINVEENTEKPTIPENFIGGHSNEENNDWESIDNQYFENDEDETRI